MKKVLFFVEPHPIRNIFVEFITPADIFSKIAFHENFSGIEWKIFSNKFLLDLMVDHFEIDDKTVDFPYPHEMRNANLSKAEHLIDFKNKLIYPEVEDQEIICSFLKEWDENEIKSRNLLVDGIGKISEFYEEILLKIYKNYQFTHVVLWSENGAVKNFCENNNVQTIHFELGPTRQPFQDTILIDPYGTNGNAALCIENDIQYNELVSPGLWMTNFFDKDYISIQETYLNSSFIHPVENAHGDLSIVTDKGFSENIAAAISIQANYVDDYVVICLQLADDLNTLNHSEYADPKDFLEDIIPKILSRGHTILIKRHPGALGRIYNLVKEIEAIEYAKNLSDNVFIMNSDTTSDGFLAVVKNAKAVISINSSASCESWILGIPGLILGKAAFDINSQVRTLSHDFINGGTRINDEILLTLIKKSIGYGLNFYFLPRNHYLLSKVLAKIVTDYTANENDNYVHWLKKNVDVFEIMMEEKLLFLNNNIALDEKIDASKLVNTSIPNESFYSFSIDEFKATCDQLTIVGWAAAEDVSITRVFIDYGDEYFFGEKISRPDIEQIYSPAHFESGFIINEKLNNKIIDDVIKIYIYGSDLKCRYINVVIN